jgi:reductive dehalogenase
MIGTKIQSKSKNKYIVGDVQRFDQKNEMYKRARWDPAVIELGRQMYGIIPPRDKDGYTLMDRALQNSLWYLEMEYAHGLVIHNEGLFGWERKAADVLRLPPDARLSVTDPAKMSKYVKKVARTLGACAVGICELDQRWVYSHSFHLKTNEHKELELPPGCKYAIAIAVEMDYDMFKTSPTEVEGAATGKGYSDMAYVAGSLAHFIRNLGYLAIPSGNDTALSIPIAVDAGLGELGRNGLLITPYQGPRVRLAKVFTDLPLAPDEPIELGVTQFCEQCRKCARYCPSQAISHGKRTPEPLNISNNGGVLKWPVDAEKCFRYWAAVNHSTCGTCIRVCAFNKPRSWFHDSVRWMVKHAPWLHSLLIKGDDLLGYGKQMNAREWWERESD